MKTPAKTEEMDWPAMARRVRDSDLPEVEKLALSFGWITGRIVEHAQREIELARAMGDRESLVKQQIKLEVTKHMRGIFRDCHRLATGREAWDE